MIRLWGILRRKQKIALDVTLEAESASPQDIHACVTEMCRQLDIPNPIWLNKQESEMEKFGRTSFSADNFIESIPYDRFEVEILREKRKSRDPRNDFSM